jgi:hypothetical protein
MDQTFETVFGNYTILVSLNERTIYFKIIDTINFTMYESNTDPKELRVGFKLADIYQIITKCFKGVDGYSVKLSIGSGICKLLLDARVGGFLEINFEVLLREKLMLNDSQLTLNFNKLEQKLNAGLGKLNQEILTLNKEIITLQDKIVGLEEENTNLTNKLAGAHLYLGHSGHPQEYHFVPIGKTVLENIQLTNDSYGYKCDYIKDMYALEKLSTNHFRYSSIKNSKLKSISLKELKILCQNEGHFTSLEGINKLPNLEILTVCNAPGLRDIHSILCSYEHQIHTITIQTCQNVNVVELQTYCQKNQIFLNIS